MAMAENYIGKATRSKEGPRHASGGGHFTDDIILPGMLQAVILRSPYAHARIVGADATAALQLPGVVAAVIPSDVVAHTRPFKPGRYAAGLRKPIPEYATAVDRVRYMGE